MANKKKEKSKTVRHQRPRGVKATVYNTLSYLTHFYNMYWYTMYCACTTVALLWKLWQMSWCSAHYTYLDKVAFDVFHKHYCWAVTRDRIWMINVLHESKMIVLSFPEISFMIFFIFLFLNVFGIESGFPFFFYFTHIEVTKRGIYLICRFPRCLLGPNKHLAFLYFSRNKWVWNHGICQRSLGINTELTEKHSRARATKDVLSPCEVSSWDDLFISNDL